VRSLGTSLPCLSALNYYSALLFFIHFAYRCRIYPPLFDGMAFGRGGGNGFSLSYLTAIKCIVFILELVKELILRSLLISNLTCYEILWFELVGCDVRFLVPGYVGSGHN